jgi:hypothetical protein
MFSPPPHGRVVLRNVGSSHITLPPAEKAAQVLKRAGRRTPRPARVVRVAGGGSGADAARDTCVSCDLAVEIPRSVSLTVYAGLTLSADTDRPATNGELECLIRACDDLVRTAVGRSQRAA